MLILSGLNLMYFNNQYYSFSSSQSVKNIPTTIKEKEKEKDKEKEKEIIIEKGTIVYVHVIARTP